MLVTLPFVLLLLDYWPLSRFQNSQVSILNLFAEKIPLLALAAVSSAVTFIVQQQSGAVIAGGQLMFTGGFSTRQYRMFRISVKCFGPRTGGVFIRIWSTGLLSARRLSGAAILLAITIAAVYFGRRRKYILFGWLWYLGTLVPVIGIVQVGAQAMADRYTYIPLIGIFIIIAFGTAQFLEKLWSGKIVPAVLAGVVCRLRSCHITAAEMLERQLFAVQSCPGCNRGQLRHA